MSGVGVVVVQVEVKGPGGGGGWTADRGLGSFSHLAERLQGNAVAWRVRACACVWSSKKYFQPNDGYETRGESQ